MEEALPQVVAAGQVRLERLKKTVASYLSLGRATQESFRISRSPTSRIGSRSRFFIVAKHSGKCIDVSGASLAPLAGIIQYTCHGGDNQRFILMRKEDGSYLIVAKHSGMCLDVQGASLGAVQLIQYPCHGGGNQRFNLPPFFSDWVGYYTTDTGWWGGFFSPLIVRRDGTINVAGTVINPSYDAATSTLSFDWTAIRTTQAKATIRFSKDNTGKTRFSGSINPRPQDGPVDFSGVSAESAPPSGADGYSHDSAGGTSNPDWMAFVDGNLPIGALSIPGTHDTMTFGVPSHVIANTQQMTLETQLNSGVRAIDIRLNDNSANLTCHHDFVDLNSNMNDVMSSVTRFLEDHPKETILMRVKQEYSSNQSFTADLRAALTKFSSYIWKNPTWVETNPTLDSVRGKVVILRDYTDNDDQSIQYGTINIQDNYQLATNWELYNSKWPAVRQQLNAANSGPPATVYMNYLSGSTGSFPYFVASGKSSPGTYDPQLFTGTTVWNANDSWCFGLYNSCPDGTITRYASTCTNSCYFNGTNQLAVEYIRSQGIRKTGIIMMDFPGAGILNTIIGLNFL